MRRLLSPLIFLVCAGLCHSATPHPLTVKEISLMLRSGYSSSTVMQEMAKRHFADTVDADKEAALLKCGASQPLIDGLKSGTYTLSAKEIAEAQAQVARQNVQSSLRADEMRKADAALQAQTLRQRSAKNNVAVGGVNTLYTFLKGDLVRLHNGAVAADEDDADLSGKKLIALYFSAHWCPPCRKFTPNLVDFYNRVASLHPEFEIIFVSYDRSAYGMQTYIRETNMPWPAIDYAKISAKPEITKYAGSAIPCLVLVDAAGKVISDSYAGKEYRGPQKVLADIDAIFAGTAGNHIAQSR
jgi:nucleoredoxin